MCRRKIGEKLDGCMGHNSVARGPHEQRLTYIVDLQSFEMLSHMSGQSWIRCSLLGILAAFPNIRQTIDTLDLFSRDMSPAACWRYKTSRLYYVL